MYRRHAGGAFTFGAAHHWGPDRAEDVVQDAAEVPATDPSNFGVQ
jgi:hypothetical protein